MHHTIKAISTASLFKTTEGNVTLIQVSADEQLKEYLKNEHTLLLGLTGKAIIENWKDLKLKLTTISS